jgi:antirestriction protein ArdC
MAKSQDICEQITTRIIAALEQGVTPWVPSWRGHCVMPRRHCGLRYRGINILILWAEAETRGFRSPFWMTFKQALEYGACVRKGERGTGIVYANRVTRTEAGENGEDVERSFSFLKGYTVFNADQIDGLPDRFLPPVPQAQPSMAWDDYAEALAWFEAIPAEVCHGASSPAYIPSQDRIELPPPASFRSPLAYLATRAHETIHWTAPESRLNRSFGQERWGDEGYALDELVAELGAAFTMAELGYAPEIREDHAPYLDHWLKVLKRDSRALLTVAAKASDALEFLCTFQPTALTDAAEDREAA